MSLIDTMHEAAQIAIANPCRFAFEAANPIFGWEFADRLGMFVLTINNGWE